MKNIFRTYQRILHTYPIIVQSVQASLLMCTGDILAQTLVEKKTFHEYNPIRTLQFGSLGIAFIGPLCTTWYRLLAKKVGTEGRVVALKKVALDQMICAPIMTMCVLLYLTAIKGHKFDKHHIKNTYVDIMINNYKVWPAVQLFNFYIMPTNYQLLVVQTVALFWNTYLAWKTGKDD